MHGTMYINHFGGSENLTSGNILGLVI